MHHPSHYVEIPWWCWQSDGFCVALLIDAAGLCILFHYVLRHSAPQNLIWGTATSDYVMCSLIASLVLAFIGADASILAGIGAISMKKEGVASLPSHIHCHFHQFGVIGSREVGAMKLSWDIWPTAVIIKFKLPCYISLCNPNNFNTPEDSVMAENFEPGLKYYSYSTLLDDCKLAVSVIYWILIAWKSVSILSSRWKAG